MARPSSSPAPSSQMPYVSRLPRALLAAVLVAGVALSVAPSRASALEPPSPLPGYRPEFVTETDVRP